MGAAPFVIATGGIFYALFLLLSSRRRPMAWNDPPDGLFYVFLVPCLNEELVIGRTIDRLLALPGPPSAVLVIDDACDDRTAEVVESYDSDRVWLLRRRMPDARKGKGAALNHAFRLLVQSDLLQGRRLEDVIVVVVDADGRLARSTLVEVAPYFHEPNVGAVQIGVRMYNATTNRLARMQDVEFVVYTEIFQRARSAHGAAGLGGNGQFARLSALASLGSTPWSDFLTEDLDLGLRLQLEGWHTAFCPRTFVEQQAVTSMSRLLRQRTRWYQGHLQCWVRLPTIMRSGLSGRVAADLSYHLMTAVSMLLMGLYSVTILAAVGVIALVNPGQAASYFTRGFGLPILVWYAAVFALSWVYATLYWMATPGLRFRRAVAYAHLYSLYSYIWVIAGCRAFGRMIVGKQGWAKTARTKEPAAAAGAPRPAA